MYRFERIAPLDNSEYPEPAVEDRSGPPLTQGAIFLLISTLASEHCTPDILAALEPLKPEAWYHGQLLETILNRFEDNDPALVIDVGKTIYYTLESQFRALGLKSCNDVITTMPKLWQYVTRGDSGVWNSRLVGPGEGICELSQPYNCRFEEGAIQGALECFNATDVQIEHGPCMRDGAEACVLKIRWQE